MTDQYVAATSKLFQKVGHFLTKDFQRVGVGLHLSPGGPGCPSKLARGVPSAHACEEQIKIARDLEPTRAKRWVLGGKVLIHKPDEQYSD